MASLAEALAAFDITLLASRRTASGRVSLTFRCRGVKGAVIVDANAAPEAVFAALCERYGERIAVEHGVPRDVGREVSRAVLAGTLKEAP